jgi:hypothetical protein
VETDEDDELFLSTMTKNPKQEKKATRAVQYKGASRLVDLILYRVLLERFSDRRADGRALFCVVYAVIE